jgi:hypothetical protein
VMYSSRYKSRNYRFGGRKGLNKWLGCRVRDYKRGIGGGVIVWEW